MMTNNLGLPLQYNTLSPYFDALDQGDASAKNQTLENILKEHHVETVLDFSCGTGAQTLWLAKRGYQADELLFLSAHPGFDIG